MTNQWKQRHSYKHKTCRHWTYCESILFRGAEFSLFEDDGHIRGYLTSWIALPKYYPKFLTDAKLRPNTETGSFAKLGISEWLCLFSYVTPEDIDPRQPQTPRSDYFPWQYILSLPPAMFFVKILTNSFFIFYFISGLISSKYSVFPLKILNTHN